MGISHFRKKRTLFRPPFPGSVFSRRAVFSPNEQHFQSNLISTAL